MIREIGLDLARTRGRIFVFRQGNFNSKRASEVKEKNALLTTAVPRGNVPRLQLAVF
jgi:hypothetical protein